MNDLTIYITGFLYMGIVTTWAAVVVEEDINTTDKFVAFAFWWVVIPVLIIAIIFKKVED